MANPEHLEILNQGVKVWNKWRAENLNVIPDLSSAVIRSLDLARANLRQANLTDSNLVFLILTGANLNEANLYGANLTHVELRFATLVRANLSQATLSSTVLNEANLTYSNLSNAILTATLLVNSNLNYSEMLAARFDKPVFGGTSLGGVDLTGAIGLETCEHLFGSVIDIQTLRRSGRLPLKFLRGCGWPDALVEYLPSLLNDPIQFYTCFISFTEADDAFSERLYNDLQAKGVRCWRWKEDAKWGKALMRSIDEAVRLYDKLIIICSEQSLNSPAVIREIERALQKEDDLARQGKEGEVLFPIRLDDYIFTRWNHHSKADVIAKNVGDFTRWKDHDSYQKAFNRLLRDLKAEDKQTAEG